MTARRKLNQIIPLGRVVTTARISEDFEPIELAAMLGRHASCDWGDVCDEDWASNNHDVTYGEGRVLSAYDWDDGRTVWVITEHDRSATTILYPMEY